MTLTKVDIVEATAEHNGYTRLNYTVIVETMLAIIKPTLESGDDVLVSGFGKFCVKAKKERRGRNSSTDGDMMLRPRKVLSFSCSGKLRGKING